MPWAETCALEEKHRFVVMYERAEVSFAELCRQFGVSRKTGYQVLARYRAGGLAGLQDRSHAPHRCPRAMSAGVREALLEVRRQQPTWGPKKVKGWLERELPEMDWPAASSIGELFARYGLSHRRRRREHAPARTAPFASCVVANDVWCADLKGWFRTGDGSLCEPFTLQDATSRYLLRVQAVARRDWRCVWPLFAAAFRAFGLPKVVRHDNGAPFATTGLGGLSPLSVRLIKAGVIVERIDPASPQQNGRLERLHRTLKEDTASPPAASLAGQARRFRQFERIYNEERPHEALGMRVPAQVYEASPRLWSGRLVSPDYAPGVDVRRVRSNGEIKWGGELVYLAQLLAGEPVGLEEVADGLWQVRYGPTLLGMLDAKGRLRRPRAARAASSPRALRTSGAEPERTEKCVTHPAG
jgi:transposase InsO family protein